MDQLLNYKIGAGEGETVRFRRLICQCGCDEDFYHLVTCEDNRNITDKVVQWREGYGKMRKGAGLTVVQIADRCLVSERTASSWNDSPPVKKRCYVALGIALGLSVRQVNDLITRYGELPVLSVGSKDDLMGIYMIKTALAEGDREFYRREGEIREIFDQTVRRLEKREPIDSYILKQEPYATIIEHQEELTGTNSKVKQMFENWLVGIGRSFNSFVRERGLRSVYSKNFSIISSEVPSRDFVIALAIQLGMPMGIINHVLHTARMEPLCAKDPLEGALMHILYRLYSELPDYKSDSIMSSAQNIAMQQRLPGGSMPAFIKERMHSEFILPLIDPSVEEAEKKIGRFLFY